MLKAKNTLLFVGAQLYPLGLVQQKELVSSQRGYDKQVHCWPGANGHEMSNHMERIRVNRCKLNKKLEGKSKRVKQSIKGRNTKITVYVDEVERPLELYEDLLYSIDDYRYYNL